jgi:hypothetical protein
VVRVCEMDDSAKCGILGAVVIIGGYRPELSGFIHVKLCKDHRVGAPSGRLHPYRRRIQAICLAAGARLGVGSDSSGTSFKTNRPSPLSPSSMQSRPPVASSSNHENSRDSNNFQYFPKIQHRPATGRAKLSSPA